MRYSELGCKCDSCPFRPVDGSPNVRRQLATPDVIAVAESPRSFGKMWLQALDVTRIPRHKVVTFSLTVCKPNIGTANKKDYEAAADACTAGTVEQIRQFALAHPKAWIFAQGGLALKLMTGKQNVNRWLGGPLPTKLEGCENRVLASFEPTYLQTPKGKAHAPIWLRHLSWAYGLATGSLPEWTWPTIHVDWTPECQESLNLIEAAPQKGADIETSGIEKTSNIRCIGFSAKGVAVCLPWDPLAAYHPQILRILGDSSTKIWQNGGFDRGVLGEKGVRIGGPQEDLMLMHAIARPQEFHGLGFIAGAETWAESHKAKFSSEKDEY
jgi:hypothetical protein